MDQFAKTLLQNTPQWVQMLAKDRGQNVKPGLGASGQWANSHLFIQWVSVNHLPCAGSRHLGYISSKHESPALGELISRVSIMCGEQP